MFNFNIINGMFYLKINAIIIAKIVRQRRYFSSTCLARERDMATSVLNRPRLRKVQLQLKSSFMAFRKH